MSSQHIPTEIFSALAIDGEELSGHPRPALVLGSTGKVLFANEKASEALEYALREFLHLQIFDISPDINVQNWEDLLSAGHTAHIHFRKKDWKLQRIAAQTREVRIEEADFKILLWENVTNEQGVREDFKQFYHDAHQPEKLARMSHFTLQRAGDAIFWIRSTGEITHVNEESCNRLGYTRKELTSLTLFEVNKNFDQQVLDDVFATLRTKGALLFESHHYTKEGKAIPVEISSNYILFEGEEYTCSIVRDITDRKRKEADLNAAFREIQALRERLEEENNYLQEEIKLSHNFGEIISQNKSMRRVLREVEQVANTQTTVLIMGESGTGKELIARDLHQLSPRSDRPMIKVNCAALPANLIESELFGHEKGAFTGALKRKKGRFELADKGTIFLDEIGELPLELQSKLLRVLQEGEFERLGSTETLKVDARVLAATNRDLEKEVKKGTFREDLFYRLNVFPIYCPPLRDRLDDIPLLVNHFCKKLEPKIGKVITNIPQKVIDRLQDYDFPGNIRELENIIERAIILSRGGKLGIADWVPKKRKTPAATNLPTLETVNRNHIVKALKATHWRISGENGAAKLLGIKPTTLESRIKKLGIKRSVDAV